MIVTALQILFSLIRYVTETYSVLSLFSFRIPRMSRPILTSFMRSRTTKPPPQRKMSPTRLSWQEPIVIFLAGSVRRDKREMLSISQKRIPPPPMLPRSAYRGIEREDPGPEQVGLGYRAVSAVGGDRGRARTVHRREGYDQLVDCWELSVLYIRNMPF